MGESVNPVKKIVMGAVGFVALAAAAIFLLRSSDEEKIEKLLKSCAESAQRGDLEAILQHVDSSCTLGEQPRSALVDRLKWALSQTKGLMIDVGSSISVSGEDGFVTLHVRVHAFQHQVGEATASLRLRKIDGEWKFVRVDETR